MGVPSDLEMNGKTQMPASDLDEERIAPRHARGHYPGYYRGSGNCHYNPHGKLVGCGKQ